MSHLLKLAVFCAIGSPSLLLAGGEPPASDRDAEALLNRYFEAARVRQEAMRGTETEVEIDAAVPRLERRGSLQAIRRELCDGAVAYRSISYSGDSGVKREVIARYLETETRVRGDPGLAISRENYSFRVKTIATSEGDPVQVIRLKPRRKHAGLFQGEIWIDGGSGMPLRETGQFVDLRSVFVKRIRFVREYEIRKGVAVPKGVESTIDTRLAGSVRLHVLFWGFACDLTQHCRAREQAGDGERESNSGAMQ